MRDHCAEPRVERQRTFTFGIGHLKTDRQITRQSAQHAPEVQPAFPWIEPRFSGGVDHRFDGSGERRRHVAGVAIA